MKIPIFSRMFTCDQQIRCSHPYINFKIKLNTCSNKRKFIDYTMMQNDGYETPSKQCFRPSAVSPDLGCVMDHPRPPARPVAYNNLHLERKTRLYVQSVIDHMNERPGTIQGAMAELQILVTHMGKTIPTFSGKEWQHQNNGYETPSKQPFRPSAVSPDLGCVMDHPRPPARPVAYEDLERKTRLYVQSVIDHMNERPGTIQDAMAELHNLTTHTSEKIPTSSGKEWQHPADFTRRNYLARFGATTPKMTLDEWQAKNGLTYKRFEAVPKVFKSSSYRS